MKTILRCLAFVLATYFCIAAPAPDVVVGRWRRQGAEGVVTLHADGTATNLKGGKGKWTCLTPNATPRKYQVIWDEGLWVDSLALVQGGKHLVGENQERIKLSFARIPELPATPVPKQ